MSEIPTNGYKIFVNTKETIWNKSKISFREVIGIAFPPPHKDTEMFIVQYSKGPRDNPNGDIAEGQTVKIKDRMVFDAHKTDKS